MIRPLLHAALTLRGTPPPLGGFGPLDLHEWFERDAQLAMQPTYHVRAQGDLAVPEQSGVLLRQLQAPAQFGDGRDAMLGQEVAEKHPLHSHHEVVSCKK
jgi:hypothetical protein